MVSNSQDGTKAKFPTVSSGTVSSPRRCGTYTDARTYALSHLRTCHASASVGTERRKEGRKERGRERQRERERERNRDTRIAASYSRDNCGLRVRERAPFARSAVPQDPKSITWLYGVSVRDAAQRCGRKGQRGVTTHMAR